MIIAQFMCSIGMIFLLLISFLVFKSKMKIKTKIVINLIIFLFFILINLVNFNFAKDTKLDNKRINNQSNTMYNESKVPPKVLLNKIKQVDNSTTTNIEDEMSKMENQIKKEAK